MKSLAISNVMVRIVTVRLTPVRANGDAGEILGSQGVELVHWFVLSQLALLAATGYAPEGDRRALISKNSACYRIRHWLVHG